MVKKIMNEPQNIVDEMLEGFVFAHEEIEWFPNYRVVALKEKKKGKVGIMSVGGSGHEPAHAGYVGKGMLDAAVAGNLFASPSPDQMLKAMEEINTGAGVLVVLKNYSGDLMNYSVAKELAQMKGIEVECVVVKDDVAVPDSTYSTGRRGIAGTIFVHKIAGAKANEGASLQEVKEAAEIANANIRSIGMSMTACTLPGLDKPGFTVADDEIEIGMGIHGEPGIQKTKIKKASELAEKFFAYYNAVFEEGALTAREKSLIALAVAHTVQCPYCIDAYTNDCLDKGVSEEQMTEAVHVAAAIRGGASLVHGVQMKNIVKKLEF